MKPGTTYEDIEKHNDTVLIHRIANMGVFYGVVCEDGNTYHLHATSYGLDGLLETMGDPVNDESRAELRERLDRLVDEGRLRYRRVQENHGLLTLTPEEWDRIIVDDAERVRSYLEATADLKVRAAKVGVEMPEKVARTMLVRWFAAKPHEPG